MKKNRLWILWLALGVAVLAIAGAVAMDIIWSRSTVKEYEHSISYFFSNREGSTRFFADDKLLANNRIGGYVDSFLTSDGTVGIARAGTGLYRIDAEGIISVYPAGVDRAALSLDGSVIVFTTATQVHIYDHRDGGLLDIAPDGATGVPSVAVSNDGNTVGYSIKTKDGNYEAYCLTKGETKKLADNAYIIAIGNNADAVYYVEPDTLTLCRMKGSSVRRIAENVSGYVEFNRELTEALFDIGGVTHYSKNGGAAQVLYDGVSVFSTKAECASQQGGSECVSMIEDTSTLFDCVYYSTLSSSSSNKRSAYNLYYVDRFCHVKELAKGTYQFALTEDRRNLACLIDGDLYAMKADSPASAEYICGDVYSFSMSADGSSFYCIAYDLSFFYVEKDGALIKLADNVYRASLTPDGNCLFLSDYSSTGTLNIAKGAITEKLRDGVYVFNVQPNAVFMYTGVYKDENGADVCDVYSSADGLTYTLALEAARVDSED